MPNRLLVPGLLCATLGLAAAGTEAQPRPDFGGTWRFAPGRSEDSRAAVVAAAGPEYTQGGSKSEADRVRFREWLLDTLGRPPDRLVIAQSATVFEISQGDDSTTFYFERESMRQDERGEKLRSSLRWDGDTLVAEERGDKGTRIVRSFFLLPERRELVMALVWEAKVLRAPLNLKQVFARAEPGGR
jgi:hypothetical protein